MRRMLVIGWLLGIVTMSGIVFAVDGWYEYQWTLNAVEARGMVNDDGWRIVPGQPNERYLRRPRFGIH